MNRSIEVMRGAAKMLSSQTIITTFSVFYFVAVTRLLTKLELSSIAVFVIITGFCAMFTGLGLTVSCLKRCPELISKGKKTEACAQIKTALMVPFVLSFIMAAGIFIFSAQISSIFFKVSDYSSLVKLMVAGVVTYKLQETLGHIFKVVQRFGKMAIIRIVNDVGGRILALILFFAYGIRGYIFGLIAGQVLSVILALFFLRDYVFSKSGFYPVKPFVRYSLPYYGDGFARYGSVQADQLIVGVFLMPELLATYYVARRFLDFLMLYVEALIGPVTPKIAELRASGIESVQKAFAKTSRYLSFALIPVSLLIASLSYPLLQIYGGDKYTAAAPLMALLTISAVIYGFYTLYAINVYILKEPIERFKQESVCSFLHVVLGFVLIIPLNLFGLGLARFFSLCGALLFSRRLLIGTIRIKPDIPAFKRTLAASSIMAAIIVLGQMLYYHPLLVPLYVFAGAMVFLVLFCRSLTKEDLQLIRDFIPARLGGLNKMLDFLGRC